MKLVSWNLNGLEDENLDMRSEAAMFRILLGAPIEHAMNPEFKPDTPDIVLLQEVVERSYHAHVVPHLKAAGFHIFPPTPSERSYFEVIAVRQPIIESDYQTFDYTDQGRGLSTVSIKGLTIMTAHFESQKPGKSMRVDQASSVLKKMNQHAGACIFAGDTNLRKSEWLSLTPDTTKAVEDAWITAGSPKKHKTTWKREPYKSRYDRAWLKDLNLKNFSTFGKNKVTGIGEPCSDHLAIRVEFEE